MKNGDIIEVRHLKHGDSLREGETLTEWQGGIHHGHYSRGLAVRLIRAEGEKREAPQSINGIRPSQEFGLAPQELREKEGAE